jgi:hypothetical protein
MQTMPAPPLARPADHLGQIKIALWILVGVALVGAPTIWALFNERIEEYLQPVRWFLDLF